MVHEVNRQYSEDYFSNAIWKSSDAENYHEENRVWTYKAYCYNGW